ncbi:MAG: hypothetical protein GX058_02420 [Firmicutes bacterium]|nr:hypothetical protein [Bacillota bacterium]
MGVTIGILQLKAELDAAVDGFKQGLCASGFAEADITFDYRNVQENVPSFGQEADDLVAQGVDLIFTCTTPAAKFAKEAAEFYGIPVVFTIVYDPVAVGLVESWESSGNHLCGVAGKVDPGRKLGVMRSLVPGLSRFAVVYDPDDPNSVFELNDLQQVASAEGICITPIKVQNPAVLANLEFAPDCQFAFVTIGRMLEEHLAELAENCLARGIPLCGHNLAAVRAGAACCVEAPLAELGYQAGTIAARILRGEDPAGLAIQLPENPRVYLNRTTCERLKLDLLAIPEAEIIEGRYC